MRTQELIEAGKRAERDGCARVPSLSNEWSTAVNSGFPLRQAINAWLLGWDSSRDERMADSELSGAQE